MRTFALTFVVSMLSAACSHIPPRAGEVKENQLRRNIPIVKHEVTYSEFPENFDKGGVDRPVFYSCALPQNPAGLGNAEVAAKALPYALMASNSYRTKAFFEIPGWKLVEHIRGGFMPAESVGFQADIYEEENCVSCRAALVFRGTDTKIDDHANYAIGFPGSYTRMPAQYQLAERLTESYRSKNANKQLIFVGHSLGGALAYHAAWRIPNSTVYAFNSSPRKWTPDDPDASAQRFDLAERGEVLRYMQWWSNLQTTKYEFNFSNQGLEEDHTMYYLARGLMHLARITSDPFTSRAAEINLGCMPTDGAKK